MSAQKMTNLVDRVAMTLVNAALLAASVLALNDPALSAGLAAWRKAQTEAIAEQPEGSA